MDERDLARTLTLFYQLQLLKGMRFSKFIDKKNFEIKSIDDRNLHGFYKIDGLRK